MTQEEKDLKLNYLCRALPYDVIVDYDGHAYILNEIDPSCKNIDYITVRVQDVERLMCAKNVMIENINPYLRSMSSMTEEERKEFDSLWNEGFGEALDAQRNFQNYLAVKTLEITASYKAIQWLLKKHFDFMGLIPKCLAIEVTKENNPYTKVKSLHQSENLYMEDYKEKYETALSRAKDLLSYKEMRQEDIEWIFSELKESEDDKMKKIISDILLIDSDDIREILESNNVLMQDVYAWLEKQGQTFTKKDADDAYLEGVCAAKSELEKQREPADNVEPKFKVKYAGSEYNVLEVKDVAGVTFYGIEDEPNHIDYVKADNCEIISGGYGIKEKDSQYPTNPAVFSEQKPTDKVEPKFHKGDIIIHKELGGDYIHNPHKIIQVDLLDKKYRLEGGLVVHFSEQDDWELVEQKSPVWSEEDETVLNNLIYALANDRIGNNRDEYVDWLKSLKGIVHPKAELTQLDKNILEATIAFVEQNNHFNCWCGVDKHTVLSALRSLRPQTAWKPTDKQMKAIEHICYGNYNVDLDILDSIYRDFKKLTEK